MFSSITSDCDNRVAMTSDALKATTIVCINPNPLPSVASQGSIPDGIELRVVDEEIGKGIFATRDFSLGEVVFMDTPMVTCQFQWNCLYKYRSCEYCMRALETAEENASRLAGDTSIHLPFPELCETKAELHVGCDGCEAFYCSSECKDRAWSEYHSILCVRTNVPPETHPQKVLDLYWRMMHYPPETASIFLLVKLLVRLHLDTDGALTNRVLAFCSSSTSENERLVHRMLGDEHLARIINLREMVKNVVNYDNVQQFLTPEAFLDIFLLVGRNGQGVGTSAFATWVANIEKLDIEKLEIEEGEKKAVIALVDNIYAAMDSHVGHFLDNEGSALYPLQSWVNHSCVANTEVKFPFKNHIVGLVARRDIQAGEEITISYLDLEDLERSRYARNKYLKEHYLFECHCPKCLEQANDDEVTSSEECSDEEMDGNDDDDGSIVEDITTV